MGPGEDPNGYWEVNHMKHTIRTKALALLTVGLMLLSTLGWTPASADTKMVEVATVDELIAAIAPNTTVALQPGEYHLDAAATYGQDTGNPYCRWEPASDEGYELIVTAVDGLVIQGAGMDKTTLLAVDRYANVLTFTNCKGLTVSALTAGHDPAPGYCSGGVLHLVSCDDVTVEGCGLFGCGTTGVWAMNSVNVTVSRSRLYECSDSAVYADGCRNVQVKDSEIDHNGWKNDYLASALFQAYGGDGFTVTGCQIHDNRAQTLLQCSYTRNTRFVSNAVTYNMLQNAFGLYGLPATMDGCTFHGNDIGDWYADGYVETALEALDLEGNLIPAEDLPAMELRSLPTEEMVEIPLREPVEVAPGGEIAVHTVDEFLAAIGPDRTIVVSDSFCLADAADYGCDEGLYYRWEICYDGPQLVIRDVYDLTIRAAENAAVTLTAVPRYADVLCFENCSNVRLSGLTLGHTEGGSECSGAVVCFNGCSEMSLDGCRLYGCGTLGVDASYVMDLNVKDCEIYECSIGGVVLYGVTDATFENCSIHDVPSPAISLYDTREVMWNNADVSGEHFDVSESGQLSPVALG